MNDLEIRNLVSYIKNNRCETNTLELKSALHGSPEKIYDSLSSFSNQDEGGRIVFGIDEKTYEPCGVYDPEKVQKRVAEQCEEMEPVVRPVLSSAVIDNKQIVVAEVAGVICCYHF